MNSKKHENRKVTKRATRTHAYQRLRLRAEQERKELDQARRDITKLTEERDAALKALAKAKEAGA